MRKLLILGPFALASCAAQGTMPVGIDQVPPGSKCVQSGALDTFKGEAATTELGARMMAASRARTLRWVPFGGVITMEYSETRLTVRLDQQNRVLSATCG
ncbi:MAG TPA: I78 family peptidase inhibitor [Sphingomicrobium sp.]|jgi:hypothetical protein